MKDKVICTVGAVVFATVSAFATQNQTPGASPMPQTSGRSGATDTPITVAGCVERSGSGATATFKLTKVERAGSVGTGRSGSTTPGASTPGTPTDRSMPSGSTPGSSTPQPANPPGSTTQSAPAGSTSGDMQSGMGRDGMTADLPREFALRPATTIDLNPHANHKIEVTGTYDRRVGTNRSGTASPAGTGATTTPAPGTSGSAQSGGSKAPTEGRTGTSAANDTPVFNVTSMRMVAATCD